MYEILRLVNEMSPYLLLGFFVAGLLHVFVPGSLYSRYLSGADLRSVLLAALFGIPLPLCSCGVIPTAMSLRKEGASKGATTSFLIATPQTGVDSIFATYSILGLPFAILRPIAALVTSVFGGLLVNAADKDREKTPQTADTDCADGEVCARQEPAYTGFVDRMKGALRYGFVDMVQDIGKWLVIGLVVAGLITLFVPDDFFVRFADRPLLAYVVVLLIAIPMYVCATGSIPVAAALMLKGLSPGAALVFLMAGPASNMASILVIRRVMGQRTLWIYLLSLTVGAIVFGLGVDFLLPRELFTSLLSPTDACCHMSTPWWQWASTVVMGALRPGDRPAVAPPHAGNGRSRCGRERNGPPSLRRGRHDLPPLLHPRGKSLAERAGCGARRGELGTRRGAGGRRRHRRRTDTSSGRHRLHAATPLR